MSKREGHIAERHEFYDVLELLNKGTFVRDFGFAKSSISKRTQPRSFQATNFQLSELSRVCMSQKYSSVLGIDATFNCGPFFVTLTSYQHKMFVSRTSGKHPVMVGPSIIHMTKEFEDYHYLASQLKKTCKGFVSLPAYGTDGEINLVNAFICELPESVHLRCKIHLADNIESKLSKLSLGKKERQIILSSIFGRRWVGGDTRDKCLADAVSADEFDQMLEEVKSLWCKVESTQHSGEPKFHSWFKQHLGQVMKENVIAPIRQIAGLGSPPEFYTQNVAECCNSMIKGDAGTKMEWSDFCVSVQETAEQQEREVKKAVHQMGEYRLAPEFKHLEVRADKWLKMTNAQREAHIHRCFSNPLDRLGQSDDVEVESISEEGESKLSVRYEDCGITTVSRSNLKQMWSSATKILTLDRGIMQVPWDDTSSQKLVFDGSDKEPCHVQVSGAAIKCACPKYKSAMMCSHSLAVAEHELCLPQFLALIRKRKKLPDPYLLVGENLPRSAGKKGAPRKGKANETQQPLMIIRNRSSTTTSSTRGTFASTVSDSVTSPSATLPSTISDNTASVSNAEDSIAAATALVALSGSQPSNDNFSIRELAGTQVRVCYGCGGIIRIPPAVPPPPHDLCIVNREYRVYRKPDGTVHITNDRQNCHYHLNPRCVKMKHGDFIPSMLNVPHMLKPKLTAVHWEWLTNEFEMFL